MESSSPATAHQVGASRSPSPPPQCQKGPDDLKVWPKFGAKTPWAEKVTCPIPHPQTERSGKEGNVQMSTGVASVNGDQRVIACIFMRVWT